MQGSGFKSRNNNNNIISSNKSQDGARTPRKPTLLAGKDTRTSTPASPVSSPSSPTNTNKIPSTYLNTNDNNDEVYLHARQHWSNDSSVEKTSVPVLYRPHSISALLLFSAILMYFAFSADSEHLDFATNMKTALKICCFFILFVSVIAFPNGPFVRPHPIMWRMAFGIGVIYELFLLVMMFMSKADARALFRHYDPTLGVPLLEKSYASSCDFTWPNIRDQVLDIFALSHFLGWMFKTIVLRDLWMSWILSVGWELLEIAFTHMLPNFAECWWDQLLLDVIICNGMGIYLGHKLCVYFEMNQHKFVPIQDIPTFVGKAQRAVQQFTTPENWVHVHWASTSSVSRFLAVNLLLVVMTVQDLNSFVLKTLLWIPPSNFLNVVRLIIYFFTGMPALRQLYIYITDPNCKRLGSHAWLCAANVATELLLIFKFAPGEFNTPMPTHIKQGVAVGVVGYLLLCIVLCLRIRSQSTPAPQATRKIKKRQ